MTRTLLRICGVALVLVCSLIALRGAGGDVKR